MSVRELQRYTAVSKYARHLDHLSRRETWEETCHRYADMLMRKYPHRANNIATIRDDFLVPMLVLPSMRGMQFGGLPIEKTSARLYNCCSSYVDRLSFFGHALYLLLCGCGVGYSVQGCHMQYLPRFSRARRSGRKLPRKVFRPEDSIEGWADCAHVLMSAYHEQPVPGFEEWHECEPEIDPSLIRKKNSPLSFGIGRAPGPMPLLMSVKRVKAMLDAAIDSGVTQFNDQLASDVHLTFSDAVVSGGVRRSANIGIFDLDSPTLMTYKTGNWHQTHPQRARANISAMLIRGEVSWAAFSRLFAATRAFGEPGFWWANHPDEIPNPCAEVCKYDRLRVGMGDPKLAQYLHKYDGPTLRENGEYLLTGFQFCNLCTINGKSIRTENDLTELAAVAAELGTYQAGFTHFPYLGPISEDITRKEALLGVSIAGVMHHPDVMLRPESLEHAAERVLAVNAEIAHAIGINPCARGTLIKPDGNSASTLGSFPGCHAGKMRRGFRISQANRSEPVYEHFRAINPEACEPSAWNQNDTDDVIRFCVEYEGMLESDMTAVQFLDHIRTLQKHWVSPGTREERCSRPGMKHNVSCTVRVAEHEWDEVARHIYKYQDEYGGVSFISVYGDRDYPQAPFTPVFYANELEKMYSSVTLEMAEAFLRRGPRWPSFRLWQWCDMALGLRDVEPEAAQWVEDLRSQPDTRQLTYAIKDLYNLNLYLELTQSYRPVDYAQMKSVNTVDFAGEVACAGGACEA